MKLKKLLKTIPIKQIKGSKEIEITGICINSKVVAPGNLFIAKRGRNEDGAQYIPEAVAAGAAAILTDLYDPTLKNVTQLIHHNVHDLESVLAANYYQFPSHELFMVGITGTNGKTTTSFLIKHLLDIVDHSCGLIGTIEYVIGQQRYQATRTTPDVSTNQKMLREMVVHGCHAAVMEVTSHALNQGRVRYIDFDVAVFTNLTIDHLDYHLSMENYCDAKKELFTSLTNTPTHKSKSFTKYAVVNADSPWHSKIIENCKAKILTYGLSSAADLYATDIDMHGTGTTFTMHYQGTAVRCHSPLAGRYNVYNVLAASAVMLTRNVPLDKIAHYISSFIPVAGRLEPVPNKLGLKIFVDFAHSDDALINVLDCLNELKKNGRIITIFGCGGDRDRTKRPKMAQACEENSDFSIVTSDNPRSEDPASIIKEIVSGFKKKSSYAIEIDRKDAIARAIEMATPEDIILIAGKGHEPYQIFAHKIVEFDDRKVASQICQQRLQKK